jgi:hypothetical protein
MGPIYYVSASLISSGEGSWFSLVPCIIITPEAGFKKIKIGQNWSAPGFEPFLSILLVNFFQNTTNF